MAASLAIADERGKGFIPQKNRIAARKGEASKSLRLLGAKASASSLPTSWDSRVKGWVTPVKDQGKVGTCWAFAANAVLETQLLMAGLGEHDLSEKNMANLNGYKYDVDSGGYNCMAEAYLLRWGGSVAETNDVYVGTIDEWSGSPPLIPVFHVQNVVWIPGLDSVSDNTTLKTAITNYGAVVTSCYWGGYYESTSNYYCYATRDANHAIAVIGWDDAYPSNNFTRRPPGNGAWLIKNSWGTDSGDNGYFHVSYYDKNFAMSEGAVFIPATEDENYDAVYGYDRLGAMFNTDDGQYSIAAAVFTSAWNEEIAAVGVYSNIADNPYEIAVYTNVTRTTDTESPDPLAGGALAAKVSGTLETAGFTTVHLPSPVKIEDGTDFAVVYRQTGSEYPQCYCASDIDEKGFEYATVDVQPGNTYFGEISGGGTNWMDLAKKDSVACLKAYTRTTAQSHCDGPEESDSGAAALEWLAVTNAPLYAATSSTFGAFAGIVGANGRTLWSSYLAGFDPADPDDGEVVLSILVTNSIPYLSWKPYLGPSARNYTVYGTESLAPSNWQPVDDLSTTKAKYFKVQISQQ